MTLGLSCLQVQLTVGLLVVITVVSKLGFLAKEEANLRFWGRGKLLVARRLQLLCNILANLGCNQNPYNLNSSELNHWPLGSLRVKFIL